MSNSAMDYLRLTGILNIPLIFQQAIFRQLRHNCYTCKEKKSVASRQVSATESNSASENISARLLLSGLGFVAKWKNRSLE